MKTDETLQYFTNHYIKAISSSADDTVEISTTLYAPDYTGKTYEFY